jgi:hypothetical protein
MFTTTVWVSREGSLDIRIEGCESVNLRYVVELVRVAAELRAMDVPREPAEVGEAAG